MHADEHRYTQMRSSGGGRLRAENQTWTECALRRVVAASTRWLRCNVARRPSTRCSAGSCPLRRFHSASRRRLSTVALAYVDGVCASRFCFPDRVGRSRLLPCQTECISPMRQRARYDAKRRKWSRSAGCCGHTSHNGSMAAWHAICGRPHTTGAAVVPASAAAVDRQHGAGGVAGGRARQEGHRVADLGRACGASEGHSCGQFPPPLRIAEFQLGFGAAQHH